MARRNEKAHAVQLIPLHLLVLFSRTRVGFLMFRRSARPSRALTWLILASVVFYVGGTRIDLAIMARSILVDYVLARDSSDSPTTSRPGEGAARFGRPRQCLLPGLVQIPQLSMEISNDGFGTAFVFAHGSRADIIRRGIPPFLRAETRGYQIL